MVRYFEFINSSNALHATNIGIQQNWIVKSKNKLNDWYQNITKPLKETKIPIKKSKRNEILKYLGKYPILYKSKKFNIS